MQRPVIVGEPSRLNRHLHALNENCPLQLAKTVSVISFMRLLRNYRWRHLLMASFLLMSMNQRVVSKVLYPPRFKRSSLAVMRVCFVSTRGHTQALQFCTDFHSCSRRYAIWDTFWKMTKNSSVLSAPVPVCLLLLRDTDAL